MIEIYPGIAAMLQALKKFNLYLVVVASKRRDMATRGLKITQLLTYFDWMVAEDDVKNAKPHKEPIERVLSHYSLSGDQCLMVGDNSHDILSAKAAGVKSVAVGWALKGADYLKVFAPDYIIDEAKDLIKIVQEEGV